MQNLLQNEFNQIAVMHGLSWDQLEQIAKIRRIKNYEDMKKEDEASDEDYYKPIFVKSSHKGNYKPYKSNGDIEKILSVYQYLNKIRSYLHDLINDHRIVRRVWKNQINMHVNFISSRDTGETHFCYVWSDNVSIMQGENANAIIRKTFNSFIHNY